MRNVREFMGLFTSCLLRKKEEGRKTRREKGEEVEEEEKV